MQNITSEQLQRKFFDAVNELCIWDIPIDAASTKEERIRVLFYIEGLRTMAKEIDDLLNGKN